MSAPIPISTSPPSGSIPSRPGGGGSGGGGGLGLGRPNTTHTPSSSTSSVSPQTPFFSSTYAFSPPANAGGTSAILRSLSLKATSPPGALKGTKALAPVNDGPFGDSLDDAEHEHDSFEFGDLNDMQTRSWGRMGRRAVSMSMSVPAAGPGGSGIAAMLARSPVPAGTAPAGGVGAGGGGSPPQPVTGLDAQGGVLADKAARGQGVLRRLSIGGFSRPAFKPTSPNPPMNQAPLPPMSAPAVPEPMPAGPPTAAPADDLRRAATLGPQRGRRYSEATRKRGVSPMGERILREHGHF